MTSRDDIGTVTRRIKNSSQTMTGHVNTRLLFMRSLVWVCALLAPLQLMASSTTSSETLLRDYFTANSVCSTSEVVSIEHVESNVTVNIVIEPATRQALYYLPDDKRNDWFSLHCPPEFHPVWNAQPAVADVLVSGAINAGEDYNLSCMAYQDAARQRLQDKKNDVLSRLKLLFQRLE